MTDHVRHGPGVDAGADQVGGEPWGKSCGRMRDRPSRREAWVVVAVPEVRRVEGPSAGSAEQEASVAEAGPEPKPSFHARQDRSADRVDGRVGR